MNSSDKLWELKKLEYKRDAKNRLMINCQYEQDLVDALVEINDQISKLLEDE